MQRKETSAIAEVSQMVARKGFEPLQTESESVVLPLHNSAGCQPFLALAGFIIPNPEGKVKPFF